MVKHLFTLLLMTLLIPLNTANADANKIIRLATTTSTDNSGLLKELLPEFQADTGYNVHVIAVGTGKALRMGRDGDVDVVLVHARTAEDDFVAQGHGEKRFGVMYNDFVIVGPQTDPAGLSKAKNATTALQLIAEHQATFVSRGDDSGTHKKELGLWNKAAVDPQGQWYREAGQGMGKVLQIAAEMDAYTLTDRGTWLAYEKKSPLKIGFEGDPLLFNPYGIIAVNPQRYPDTNHRGAQTLIRWLISPEGQERINNFRIGSNRLFTPSADAGEFAAAKH
ncbi:MAG: substrate-binding domain-containing protein [Candidatus Thiodiazotropha lotti]|uniref:Substrate-binding domain-containing protein n=1 Tax=Candidatus Thiodiazotropha lotti TaxID=2792787 RepID=A0A9E4MZN3_9GAMM|nr:substrate-binding domain-containing protein [Candidatus Thiodiazotropha lotti]ODB99851.1 tungsten ABC transporter substrate-binding protein [Candidatus Thiodiazotropha endoloripes]MCG7921468.1 substrate-binding domain-containing protein [Candidatus Thiodiazotropha lotti]MCG7938403.1 substrate-binding domain-containing protein [Candidatus Thiodiazotropha lotti]MCG7985784.1 substrate-binding domain-containing protein [Candidatus Thiodiazotropha lotti]